MKKWKNMCIIKRNIISNIEESRLEKRGNIKRECMKKK